MTKSVIDTIVKLRAKAEDPSVGEAEAEAFAAKVAELLAKHDLTESDLDLTREEIIQHHWHTTYCDPWRRNVCRAAARLYFCDIFLRKWWDQESRRKREGIVFVGRPEHVFVAHQMSEYLIDTVSRLGLAYVREYSSPVLTRRKMELEFERGCGERLAQRLREMREAREAGERKSTERGNPANLPALYDEESRAVQDYKEGLKLGVYHGRASKLSTIHAAAGIAAANDVSLADQITADDPGDPT